MPKARFEKIIPSVIKNPKLIKERRNQIFEAASKLFKKKGYHATGLRELSKEAGISPGNLYNYINTKEDILYIIHQKAAEMVLEAIDQETSDINDPVEKLKEMIKIELLTMDKYQDLILLIYQESHALSKKSLRFLLRGEEMHIRRFQKVLEDGIKKGVFKRSNSIMLANLIKMMIDCWVLKRWTLRGKVSLEEVKKEIFELVQCGIMNKDQTLA
jgi:AcrR family transcriptional regulator